MGSILVGDCSSLSIASMVATNQLVYVSFYAENNKNNSISYWKVKKCLHLYSENKTNNTIFSGKVKKYFHFLLWKQKKIIPFFLKNPPAKILIRHQHGLSRGAVFWRPCDTLVNIYTLDSTHMHSILSTTNTHT